MINVIGLGYIGLPTALMMASHGVEVIGTDYNKKLVDTLNAGHTTFKEDGLDELFQAAVKAGIKFTTEYQKTDMYIVSVPTPYDKFSKKVDACYVVAAIKEVMKVCPKGATVVIESTVSPGTIDKFVALYEEEIIKDNYGKPIRVKTLGQKVYVDSVKKHDIVFGIGPAGTGKTFLAVTLAVTALKRGQVKRIILTRPAVEAGESLGFLPGDLKEKVDPYLRPVYDALYQILGKEQTTRLMEREIIEIAPLAYMRGRTLDDAFVILDEAQNTTIMQMKMFLTRLGFNSKMIVNGDTSQIDLPRNVKSGLIDATQKLKNIEQIDFIYLSAKDVVRHPVVAEIITAYEEDTERPDMPKESQKEETASGLTSYEVIDELPTSDES